MTAKLKAYPIPRNMKDIQVFVGILRSWRTFIPHLAQCLHPLCRLMKRRHTWNWGSGQQAAFEMEKVLVKLIAALGTSQAGQPFKLDVSVTSEHTVAETTGEESTLRIFVPALGGGGQKPQCTPHRATAPCSVHRTPHQL